MMTNQSVINQIEAEILWQNASKSQTDFEEDECFYWIRKYNMANEDKKEGGANIKAAENASITEPNCKTILVKENTGMMPSLNTQWDELEKAKTVNAELKKDYFNMVNELSITRERCHVMEQKMKSMKDDNMVDIRNQQVKHNLVVIKLKENMTKMMANKINHDELKNEEEMFLKKELCKLRDNFYLMEQRMKKIDDSVLSQNQKYNKAIEKLQVTSEVVSMSSANEYSNLRTEFEKMNHQMEKLVNIVNSLKCEKETLIQTTGKMAKEINSSERNNILNRKVFNKFKNQMKKDMNDVKKHLNSLKNAARTAKSNVKPENISCRKYDKIKMRLTMIERAEVTNKIIVEQMRHNMTVVPSAYIRGGVNDLIANVHYEARHQQAQSPHSVTPSAPPSASPSVPPKVPASPSFGPPLPSFVSPELQSGPPRYTINNDLLKAMSSELRKPDGKNIRKIPRRQDMIIPTQVEKATEQKVVLLKTAAPLPVIASEVPIVTSEQSTLETLESTDVVSQAKISEAPLAVVDTQSTLEPPAPSKVQSSSLADSESTGVPQVEKESALTTVDSEISVMRPELLVPLVDSETHVVP